MEGLDDWLADQQDKRATIDSLGIAALRDQWAFAALDTWVQPLLDDAERASPAQWDRLRGYVRELTEGMSPDVWRWVRAEPRVKLWLLLEDRRERLADLVAERWFEQGNRPTRVVDGAVHAELPFYGDRSVGIPDETFVMEPAETPLTAVLRDVTWVSQTRFDVTLFVWIDFVGHDGEVPEIDVSLVHQGSGARVELPVARQESSQVTHAAGHRYQDYRHGAVTVSVDTAALAALGADAPTGTDGQVWAFELRTAYAGIERSGGITRRDERGTAGLLISRLLAPRRVGDVRVGTAPDTSLTAKVTVLPASPVRLVSASVTGRRVSGVLTGDLVPVEVRASGPQSATASAPVRGDSFDLELPKVPRAELGAGLAAARGGRGRQAAPDPLAGRPRRPVAGPRLGPRGARPWLLRERRDRGGRRGPAARGRAAGSRSPRRDRALAGSWIGRATSSRWRAAAPPSSRSRPPGTAPTASSACRSRSPGTSGGWAQPRCPLDRYHFGLTHGAKKAEGRVMYDVGLLADTLSFQLDDDFLMRPFRGRGEVGVVLARPLARRRARALPPEAAPAVAGARARSRSTRTRSTSSPTPGPSATDSQLAHPRRAAPHADPTSRCYWGVADRSATVPEGAVPVLLHSREWYRVLAHADATSSTTSTSTAGSPSGRGSGCCRPSTATPSKSMGIRLWAAKQFTPRRIDAGAGPHLAATGT